MVFLVQSPFNHKKPANINYLLNVNIISAMKAGEYARKSGVKRFLYASTGNVYAPSFAPLREDSTLRRDNWYSLSKIDAEESLTFFQDQLKITVVMLFGVYGPGQTKKACTQPFKFVFTRTRGLY